jgi:5'-methylthioadenosine phosphorylase
MFRTWGADVVGMTLVPECVLAREAEICYASIAMVTDYDVWKDHPVCVDDIVKTMKANIENVKHIIGETIVKIPKERKCECKNALKSALV